MKPIINPAKVAIILARNWCDNVGELVADTAEFVPPFLRKLSVWIYPNIADVGLVSINFRSVWK